MLQWLLPIDPVGMSEVSILEHHFKVSVYQFGSIVKSVV